jgi:threonine dehydratase
VTNDHRIVRPPSPADVDRGLEVVRGHLEPTPIIDLAGPADTRLKLECLQPTGSFKVRGALAAVAALSPAEREAGVVAASAGNHALGLAYAAGRLGIPTTLVMPTTASPAKVAALRKYPVHVVLHGDGYFEAERHALELAADGPVYLSAYNDPHVIAGQASLGAEIGDQVPGPLTIVVPVGGGGLAAGVCLWAARRADTNVIGVEAEASRAVSTAIQAGRVVSARIGPTLADGLAGNIEPTSVTPGIIGEHAAGVVAVSEREIRQAMRLLVERHGLVAEGSGAVAVAAILAGTVEPRGTTVAVVTGRNIALPTLVGVLSERTI